MRQTGPLAKLLEFRVERINDLGQTPFLPQVEEDVFVGGDGERETYLEAAGQGFEKLARIHRAVAVVFAVFGEEALVLPNGHPIFAPVTAERPTGKLFAGIPLALTKVQQRAGGETVAHFQQQFHRQPAFRGAHRGGRPLAPIAIVERDEGRLAAHGEAHIPHLQIDIDLVAEGFDLLPLLVRVGLGDARGFVDPLDSHRVAEIRLAEFQRTGDGSGAAYIGGAGERDMSLSRQQP